METENPVISQKEYLKRYLSKDKSKKKKKKEKISSSSHLKRSIIIDDDLGLKDVANVDDEEFNLDYLGDEAPQIAGIIDERPAELRAKEKYNNSLWLDLGEVNKEDNHNKINNESKLSKMKTLGSINESDSELSLQKPEKLSNKNEERSHIKREDGGTFKEYYRKRSNETDLSPKRKSSKYEHSDSDMSPPRVSKICEKDSKNKDKNRAKTQMYLNENSDSDVIHKNGDHSRRRNYDKDKVLQRERNSERYSSSQRNRDLSTDSKYKKRKENLSIKSRKREYSNSDESPERDRYQKKKDSIDILKRKECADDSDLSPARDRYQKRRASSEKMKRKGDRNDGISSGRDRRQPEKLRRDHRIDDISPARDNYVKRKDVSEKLRKKKNGNFSDSDQSQPRGRYQKRKELTENIRRIESGVESDSDLSPARSYKKRQDLSENLRKREQRHGSDYGFSFERDQSRKTKNLTEKKKTKEQRVNSDSDLSPTRDHVTDRDRSHKRPELMVDGKKSGLQSASKLREELKRLKEAENKLFKKMDPSSLGAKTAPVLRDRKTGLIRNLEREREEERDKAEKRAESEKKYYKWGKGLKQMQDKEDQLAEALHEMSKPLARYKDDKDLDALLRAQEREGDPMLEYIKNKQAESHDVIDLTSGGAKPKYNGSFMPNRFGIKPGYRWDGVDRSNGYEKKWFEQKNARKAIEEQAYKWSTSDM